ncbi:MAG: hypothetical protein HY297_04250 [Thaumarchaeota archaeon]|nr:hypothetical protein [Nitrososphaerota archaeon]
MKLSYVFVLSVLATGITLGFLGGFWGRFWIWTAIIVAFVMMGLMYRLGTHDFNLLRRAVGLAYSENRKKHQPLAVVDAEALDKLLDSPRSTQLSVIGVAGLLIIAWLMFFKPF